jgi:hypothetical protein
MLRRHQDSSSGVGECEDLFAVEQVQAKACDPERKSDIGIETSPEM